MRFSTLGLVLLLPGAAAAGWGDESWGEMVWGRGIPEIPAIPVAGAVALAALLLGASYWLLARRSRRAKGSPLRS